METGYEIITLWVSRMIMMSFFALDEIPFSKVYLHGMILDKNGKKMSKSKGNGINPLDMIAKFGTDATRLVVLMGSTPGNDSRFSEDKVEAKRNFINKLWNISRFILTSVDEKFYHTSYKQAPKTITLADQWIVDKFAHLIWQTTEHLNNFDFSLAAEGLTEFTWNELADWYLEIAKIEKDKEEILIYILKNLLILWHPFIPFITEKIWSTFNDDLLMVAVWPTYNKPVEIASSNFDLLRDIIVAVRNARSEHKIMPAQKLAAVIYGRGETEFLSGQKNLLQKLKTGLDKIDIAASGEKPAGAITIVVRDMEIYLIGAVDESKEKDRLLKERANLEKMVAIQEKKLSQADFVNNAPAAIVEAEQWKLADYQTKLKKIIANISNL